MKLKSIWQPSLEVYDRKFSTDNRKLISLKKKKKLGSSMTKSIRNCVFKELWLLKCKPSSNNSTNELNTLYNVKVY